MIEFMDVVHFLQRHSILAVMLSFSLIVLWAYWPSHRAMFDERARIPLDDDR